MFYFILCCITKEVTSVVLVGRRFYIRVYGGLNKNVLITKPIYLRGWTHPHGWGRCPPLVQATPSKVLDRVAVDVELGCEP